MTRRNWIVIPAALSTALALAIVALLGDTGTPAGLLLAPIAAIAAPFMALPLAVAFTTVAITSLGITYWADAGADGATRIVVEASLIVMAATASRYAVSRLESRSSERRLMERIRSAASSSALLDRVYEDIYQALKASLPVDRFAIVVERPGGDELEVAYASGIPVAMRETGDVAPLIMDENGWVPIGDGRVMSLSGGGGETGTEHLVPRGRTQIRVASTTRQSNGSHGIHRAAQ
ncbi:MAG: hypothetical protein QF554_10090 [Dehalococcoidia bacterium]|jgi:hypothetical protein|nr:hypothetical protein [Dehalococcoidia bacterium]